MMHPPSTLRGARRGMTLIEVMLAVSILATIVVLTWGALSQSFRLRTVSLEKFERYRTIQMSLDRMSREVSMAFTTNIGQVATNLRGEITYRTTFEGSENELHFTSLAHVRTRTGEAASEQCEISYRLERQRGEDGRMQLNLVRRMQAPIDDKPDEGGVKYVLLHDVERLRIEYWDSTREIAGNGWVRQWDAFGDHNGQLPSRVRISVDVQHPTIPTETLTFSTQATIHLEKPLVVLPPDVAAEQRAMQTAIEDQLLREGFTDDSMLRGQDFDDFYRDP